MTSSHQGKLRKHSYQHQLPAQQSQQYTVYCLSFVVKNFCSFKYLPSFHEETFTVASFYKKFSKNRLRLQSNLRKVQKFFTTNNKQYTVHQNLVCYLYITTIIVALNLIYQIQGILMASHHLSCSSLITILSGQPHPIHTHLDKKSHLYL